MGKLGYYWNRLKTSGLSGELPYRIKQQWQERIADKYFPPKQINDLQFNVSGDELTFDRELLKSILPADFKWNSYKYFLHELDPTEIRNWHIDLKHQVELPIKHYTQYVRQEFEATGDIKYIHEISRFHFSPILALKALAENDTQIAALVIGQMLEWIKQNPFLHSINWVRGIEAGVRAINWLYALDILVQNDLIKEIPEDIRKSLYQHAHFIRHHYSLYSSANNHLVAELAGLVAICAYCDFPESDAWLTEAFEMQMREIELQVHPDGFNKEQATHYHSFSFYLFLISIRLAAKKGLTASAEVMKRMRALADAMIPLTAYEGDCIEIGDSDDAKMIYPYGDKSYDLYIGMMSSAAIQFDDANLLHKNSYEDLSQFVLFGSDGIRKLQELKSKGVSAAAKSVLLKDSGYAYFIGSGNRLIFDCGEIGLRPMAAHGHADCLQVILDVDGDPVLVDPGTFQYHDRYVFWQKYFRSTLAHNTISIDGLDSAQRGGKMIWHKQPDVKIEKADINGESKEVIASHDGFKKQGVDVIHRRKVRTSDDCRSFEIEDSFEGNGGSELFLNFHLHPELKDVNLSGLELTMITPKGRKVILKNEHFSKAALIKGDEKTPLGWYSPKFEVKQACYVLRLQMAYSKELKIQTLIKVG